MKIFQLLLVLAASFTFLTGHCAPLNFSDPYKNPIEGVAFKYPTTWSTQPLPVLTNFRYTRTFNDGRQEKVIMHDPRELWLQNQHLAQISGTTPGAKLMLASPTAHLPTFEREHILPEEYNLAVAQAGTIDWSDETMQKNWLRDYAAVLGPIQSRKLRLPFRKLPAYEFMADDLYAVTFVSPLNQKLYCLYLDLPTNTSRAQFETYRKALCSTIRLFKPRNIKPKQAALDTGSSRYQQPPEFIASKQKVIDNLQHLPNWWYLETPNYIICSDMPEAKRDFAIKIMKQIEIYRYAYEQVFTPWEEIKAVSVVRIFDQRADYENYVGDELRWSGGVWMPMKQELVISPPIYDHEDPTKAEPHILSVLYHEALHQYLHYCCQEIPNAPWFNEGYATFFEETHIEQGAIEFSKNSPRLPMLRKIVKEGRSNIKRIVDMTYPDFYAPENRYYSYPMAWGLIFYLQTQCTHPKHPYARILPQYRIAFKESQDRVVASRAAFKGINLEKFQRDFDTYWLDVSDRFDVERVKLFRKPKK